MASNLQMNDASASGNSASITNAVGLVLRRIVRLMVGTVSFPALIDILIQWAWFCLIIRVLIGFRLSIIGVHKIAGTHLALTLAYAMRVQCVSSKYAHALRHAPLRSK